MSEATRRLLEIEHELRARREEANSARMTLITLVGFGRDADALAAIAASDQAARIDQARRRLGDAAQRTRELLDEQAELRAAL